MALLVSVCWHAVAPHCREEVVSEYNKLLPKKYLEQLPGGITMRSKGCSKCGNTGIVGRLPILEIIRFNDELRDLFSEQVGWVKSKELLKKNNFITLWQRGFELVKMVKFRSRNFAVNWL